MKNNGIEWIYSVIGDDAVNAVAKKIGVTQPRLARQVKGESPLTPEIVVLIARAYGVNPIDGLVAQGLITSDEIRQLITKKEISYFTDMELAVEVLRRAKRQKRENDASK